MGKPQGRATIRSRPQACNTGPPDRRPTGAGGFSETSSDAPELSSRAVALRRSKVCPKGNRKSHQRFSGYPNDYLAPSLFERWRCACSADSSTESGAFDGKAYGGVSRTALPGSDAPGGRANGKAGCAFGDGRGARDGGHLKMSEVDVLSRRGWDEAWESVGCARGISSSLLPTGDNGLDRRYIGCHSDLSFNGPDTEARRKYSQPLLYLTIRRTRCAHLRSFARLLKK
jgi:hypothetical protein